MSVTDLTGEMAGKLWGEVSPGVELKPVENNSAGRKEVESEFLEIFGKKRDATIEMFEIQRGDGKILIAEKCDLKGVEMTIVDGSHIRLDGERNALINNVDTSGMSLEDYLLLTNKPSDPQWAMGGALREGSSFGIHFESIEAIGRQKHPEGEESLVLMRKEIGRTCIFRITGR